jgi:hypothetical protein
MCQVLAGHPNGVCTSQSRRTPAREGCGGSDPLGRHRLHRACRLPRLVAAFAHKNIASAVFHEHSVLLVQALFTPLLAACVTMKGERHDRDSKELAYGMGIKPLNPRSTMAGCHRRKGRRRFNQQRTKQSSSLSNRDITPRASWVRGFSRRRYPTPAEPNRRNRAFEARVEPWCRLSTGFCRP